MKFVTDKSKGILGSPDSVELWTQIIEQIPEDLLRKPGLRILNIACGHCTEAVILANRMLSLGIDPSEVQKSFTLLDKYQVFTNPAKMLYGFENVITADFLDWRTMEKFDIVLANPPYQDGNQGNYWFRFLTQSMNALKPNGFCGYVIPATWGGVSSFKTNAFKLDYFRQFQVEGIDFTATNYFSVGIKICSIILRNSKPTRPTTIVTDSETFEVDLRECQAFPFEVSSMSLSILNKILSRNDGQLYPFKEKVGANAGAPKVYLLNAPYLGFEHIRIDNTGECADTWKISMLITSDQVGVSSVFRCRLGEFYINNVGGLDRMLGVSAMKNYPHLDLSRVWTDAEIYEHFEISSEEIGYIESMVK